MASQALLHTVLIANRGEIAVRVARACKDAGLTSVAVYADPDRDAPHVRLADQAFALGGETAADSYLNIEKIINAAKRVRRRTAIHPGYGFLSENADFAQAVIDAGLIWIGPSPQAIRDLGDKVTARKIAERAGAPLVPGTRTRWPTPTRSSRSPTSTGCRSPSRPRSAAAGAACAWPASATRSPRCSTPRSARRSSAFGRGESFVERYLDRPRHVEAQVLADQHGNCIVVGTRDCSLQRRHQKLVEEAPGAVPDRRAAQAHPHLGPRHLRRGRLLRRGHRGVPRRRGRHDLVPRGQHPPAGRAPGLRGDQRPRPGPRAVPDRQRRGAAVPRRPRAARALDRVPAQRRGRRPRLPARARHRDPVRRAVGARRARRRGRRVRHRHRRPVRLDGRQADRHRRGPRAGARSARGARWTRSSSRACRPSSRSTASSSTTRRSPRPRAPPRSSCTPGGSRPSGTTRRAVRGRGRVRRRRGRGGRASDGRRRGRRQAPRGLAARRALASAVAAGPRRPRRQKKSRKRAGGGAKVSGDAVTSPMQGTVVKVAVSEGDTVVRGRPRARRRGHEDGEPGDRAQGRHGDGADARGGCVGEPGCGDLRDRRLTGTSAECPIACSPSRTSGNRRSRRLRWLGWASCGSGPGSVSSPWAPSTSTCARAASTPTSTPSARRSRPTPGSAPRSTRCSPTCPPRTRPSPLASAAATVPDGGSVPAPSSSPPARSGAPGPAGPPRTGRAPTEDALPELIAPLGARLGRNAGKLVGARAGHRDRPVRR